MNFFIVGVGRSGTSLLQSILSSHSSVCIPPETGFVRKNILSRDMLKNFSIKDILNKNDELKRLGEAISKISPKASWDNEITCYKEILESYRSLQNKELVGDKDPRLIEYILSVNTLFPNTEFIHLIRDPRDVLLSKKKAAWSKDRPSWYHVFANYVQLKLGQRQGKKIEDNYFVVCYEELLSDTERIVSTLCNLLGVEFEHEMLSFQETASRLVSEEEKQWKKETTGPLLKNNTGKWQGKLNNWEVALTELLCTEAFSIGGYEKSKAYNNLSFLEKMKVKTLFLILKFLGLFYVPFRLYSQKLLVKWKY